MVADSITDSELFQGSPISRDFAKKGTTNRLKQWKIDAFRKQLIYQYDEEISRRLKKLTDTKSWRIEYEEGSYKFTKFDDDETISSASSPTSVLKDKDSVNEDCFCCSNPMLEEEEEDVFDSPDNVETPQIEVEDLEQEEGPMTPITNTSEVRYNWDTFREALNSSENDNVENPQLETEDLEQEEEEDPILNKIWRRNKLIPRKLFQDNKRVKPPETSSEETIERKGKKMKKMESNSEKQEDDKVCAFCSEVIDATDLIFEPCPCGFRVCLKCHRMISENEGRCPACKREYDEKNDEDEKERFLISGRGPISLCPSFKGLDKA